MKVEKNLTKKPVPFLQWNLRNRLEKNLREEKPQHIKSNACTAKRERHAFQGERRHALQGEKTCTSRREKVCTPRKEKPCTPKREDSQELERHRDWRDTQRRISNGGGASRSPLPHTHLSPARDAARLLEVEGRGTVLAGHAGDGKERSRSSEPDSAL
jgi:hypothetical protein